MAFIENPFLKVPFPEEKQSRLRKYNLYRARKYSQEAVKELSEKYFIPQVSEALNDPAKCVLMLQKLMSSKSEMKDLSDFVAICFVFTYQNHQSYSAAGLLKHCLQQDFKFDDEELKLMMKTMIDNPPKNLGDIKFCSQIIAQICKKSDLCLSLLIEQYQKSQYSEEQANFLKNISKEISLDREKFNDATLQILSTDLKIDQSLKKEHPKKTPTDKKMNEVENNTKINSLYSKFQNYQTILFAILTVLILLGIVAIL